MTRVDGRHARWLGFVGDLLQQPLCDLPLDVIAQELTATFCATGSCWTHRTGDRGSTHPWPPNAFRPEELAQIPVALGSRQPLVRWYDHTASKTPQTLGRVPSAITDTRSVAIWRELSTPLGIEHQILIPLHIAGTEMRVFVSARTGTDFTDSDLELATLIQPVLVGLDRQAATLRRWQTAAGAPPLGSLADALHDVRLTGREIAVLSLLAEGLTASAISRRLHISPRTVSKHQEHLYAKLHAPDRLTAVLRAQRAGLVPQHREDKRDCPSDTSTVRPSRTPP
jgi:DNA-binding CsgD family transcriptional regulator